jgi:shikimate kinase
MRANVRPGNVVLIGMRASGKTTLGRALAERIGRPFTDLDEEVGRLSGRSAEALLRDEGEAAFRAVEARALAAAARLEDHVIATGGGAVLHGPAFAALAATGTVVWLAAAPGTLHARAAAAPRPPLTAAAPAEEVAELLRRREPLYRAAAQFVVRSDGPDPILALLHVLRSTD